VGKASFDLPKLLDNAKTFVQVVNRAKPATIKGNYIKSIYLTSSQGPSVRVDPASFQ
jgi:large subunit ribosomal protein L1